MGLGNNTSSSGSICAILKRVDGAPVASNVTGLKIVFPTGQDNNGAGYAEVAAYASVPAAHAYTWSNATGNKLFSDAGNWTDDATGAAAGAAGAVFGATCFDTLAIPTTAEVIVDKSATVFSMALGAGATLVNPDASTTNTLTLCKLSYDGTELTTIHCGIDFCEAYDVALSGPVNFAGGAAVWAPGTGTSAYEHTFMGDFTFKADLGVASAEPTWKVPSGSRLSAPVLKKKTGLGNQNGDPAFRIEEGGYAHFGSVVVGRDRLYLSVQGEIEVDGLFSVRSVYTSSGSFPGDFGYTGDEAYAASTIRADGLLREKDSQYGCYYSCVYPANIYIGAQGIAQETADNGIKFVGCAKNVYATADFSIRGPDAASGLLVLEADATFDTQGHMVTWTSGISGTGTLTKTGEGTLVMSPAAEKSAFTGSIAVHGGVLAIANDVFTTTSVALAKGAAIAVGMNRTVPAAGVVTASGAAKVIATGDMSEAKIGDTFPVFASCTPETFVRLKLDASGLQGLPRKLSAALKRNPDGSVSMIIIDRGVIIFVR